MDFQDAVTAIPMKRALLFVGAGFSLEATNTLGDYLPASGELSRLLMEAVGSSEQVTYGLAAELFVQNLSAQALIEFLRRHLTVVTTSAGQETVASAPWRRIYTTNFDNVLEHARAQSGKDYITLEPNDAPPPISAPQTAIVHLHGNVTHDSATKSALTLTQSSLTQPAVQRTAWPTQIQVDIDSSDAIFVVGYSLADFHIANLLRTTSRTRRKTFVIVEENPGIALSSYLSKFGTVVPIGVAGFSRAIAEAPAAPTNQDASLICFERVSPPEMDERPTTEASVALLLTGLFDDAAYRSSQSDGAPPYAFPRRRASTMAKANPSLPVTLVLQSRIGNGKSAAIHQIAIDAALDGTAVYLARHPGADAHAELDRIRHNSQSRMFIFDSTEGFEPIIRNVNQNLAAGDVLILSTRFADSASDSSPIRSMLPQGYGVLDLNTLSDEEAIQLESWIAYYGLWGAIGGGSQPARLRFIKDVCGREVRSVVLSLFQKGALSERITHAVGEITKLPIDVRLAFSCLLLARFADCPIDFFDVCELCDVEPYSTRDELIAAGGSEFLQLTQGDFEIRSSVLAEFLLAHCIDVSSVFDALIVMIDQLTTLLSADWRYEESLPNLMKFSIISKIFSGEDRRPFIIPFYERLLRHKAIKSNPHFWLQFAMARMERDDFSLAAKCLENAYAEAKRRGASYRTYMLDNQQVKFLLRSRTVDTSYPDKAEAFVKAVALFSQQVSETKRGIDVHVLRLIEPLLEFRRTFFAMVGDQNSRNLDRELGELRHRVGLIGLGEGSTPEERRLVDLLYAVAPRRH